jgi:hypothetical protein
MTMVALSYIVVLVLNVLVAAGYVPPSAREAGITAAVLLGMLLWAVGSARRVGDQTMRELADEVRRRGEGG